MHLLVTTLRARGAIDASARLVITSPHCSVRATRPPFSTQSNTSALLCSHRAWSSTAVRLGNASRSLVTAEDLRRALSTLGLSTHCTDAEIKSQFQQFAKANHPDTFAPTAGDADEAATRKKGEARMFEGTQAYQLLRQLTFDDRQRILNEQRFRSGDAGAFRYSEDEYRKAQAAYEGRRRPRASSSSSMDAETAAFNADFFDPNTHQGRTHTSQFNQFQDRIRNDRQRRASFNMHSRRTADGERVKSTAPSGSGFRLHFLDRTWEELKDIRRMYHDTPGFAGMDGSRYDTDANAARAGPELKFNPHLKQYLTMRQRAREKKVLDNAIGGAVTAALFFVACFAMAVLTVAGYRKIEANRNYAEIQKRRQEERGGG